MATYADFCSHYGYDPADSSSRVDYERYKEAYATLRSPLGEGS